MNDKRRSALIYANLQNLTPSAWTSSQGTAMDMEKWIYTLVEVFIAVCCCLGNMLVVLALWKTRSIQQPTYCLILSLAAADLLVGAVAIPFALLVDGRVNTSFYACLFISCAIILLTLVSVLCLMAIAVDRFLRIFFPFWYKKTVTWRHSYFVAAACWILGIPLSFTPVAGWHGNKFNDSRLCNFTSVICQDYLVYFNFFLCTLTPLLVMTVLYSCVFCYIRENLREKPGNGTQNQSQNYLKKEKQLASSLALVLALFALSWLPLHIMNCLTLYKEPGAVSTTTIHAGIALSHANSAVNPVVYAFKIKKIKRAYINIWKRYMQCKENSQGPQFSNTEDMPSCNNISETNNI